MDHKGHLEVVGLLDHKDQQETPARGEVQVHPVLQGRPVLKDQKDKQVLLVRLGPRVNKDLQASLV